MLRALFRIAFVVSIAQRLVPRSRPNYYAYNDQQPRTIRGFLTLLFVIWVLYELNILPHVS